MRTPIHVMPIEPTDPHVQRQPGNPSAIMLRDLIVSAGPRDDVGRLVRVILTERQAQALCIELGRLFGADTEPKEG